MTTSFSICILAFSLLVIFLRSKRVSLGLPIAYLFALLLQHLPGGLAYILRPDNFPSQETTETGLKITAWGVSLFVLGVIAAQMALLNKPKNSNNLTLADHDPKLIRFCLLAGWFVIYIINPLVQIPSIGAALDQGSSIWILGVLLGLSAALAKGKIKSVILWMGILVIYPISVLIDIGFMSFGSTSVFVVASAILVYTKSKLKAYLGLMIFAIGTFLIFVSYFQAREDLRKAVWGGAGLNERIEKAKTIVTEFQFFDADNPSHLNSLDARLNQNKFIGMAAENLDNGRVDYLRGKSVSEALLALIPRLLWPDKPIFAGNSKLIREISLKEVNETTTFGVGLIMEFYVNFGMYSLIIGSLLFGVIYGLVDKAAALNLNAGKYPLAFLWFLVGMALNAPLGLISKMSGDVISSIIAACFWAIILKITLPQNALAAKIHEPVSNETPGVIQ